MDSAANGVKWLLFNYWEFKTRRSWQGVDLHCLHQFPHWEEKTQMKTGQSNHLTVEPFWFWQCFYQHLWDNLDALMLAICKAPVCCWRLLYPQIAVPAERAISSSNQRRCPHTTPWPPSRVSLVLVDVNKRSVVATSDGVSVVLCVNSLALKLTVPRAVPSWTHKVPKVKALY